MRTIIILLVSATVAMTFIGCCEKCEQELELCRLGCKETPPQPGSEFTLSLIFQKSSEQNKRFQTMFIESPEKKGIGNSFVLAGTFSYGSYDNRTKEYLDVKVEKVGIRRLAGRGHRIVGLDSEPIEENGEMNKILITLDSVDLGSPHYDEHLVDSDIRFSRLKTTDRFESELVSVSWGPRICELYVSSPSK